MKDGILAAERMMEEHELFIIIFTFCAAVVMQNAKKYDVHGLLHVDISTLTNL